MIVKVANLFLLHMQNKIVSLPTYELYSPQYVCTGVRITASNNF